MINTYDTLAVSFGDTHTHKVAALFFDRFYPLGGPADAFYSPSDLEFNLEREFGVEQLEKIWQSAAKATLGYSYKPELRYSAIDLHVHWMMQHKECLSDQLLVRQAQDACRFVLKQFVLALRRFGIPAAPLFGDRMDLEQYLGKGDESALSIIANDFPIMDVSKIKWEQVGELRKDKDSKRDLRNIRTFLFQEYKTADPDFIRDDLQRRLDQYEAVCRKYGFELVTSTLNLLLDSKSLLAISTLSLAAVLLGGAAGLTLAALSGATIELGRMALNFAERRYEHKAWERNHELAYLIRLNSIGE